MKINQLFAVLLLASLFASCSSSKYVSVNKRNVSSSKEYAKAESKDPSAWDVEWKEEEKTVEEAPYLGVNFQQSDLLRPLLEQAKAEGKLVFVDFYASWCAPCKTMDKNVFPDKRIGDLFNANFINYKVDADGAGSHIAAIYEIRSLPTLLFLDTNGNVLVLRDGAAGISDLTSLAKKAQQLNGASAGGN